MAAEANAKVVTEAEKQQALEKAADYFLKDELPVGDDSQSIYSFRGANFRNIMDFPKQFDNARVITLEENYRSTQPILAVTNEVIAASKERHAKELFSRRTEGERPRLTTCEDEDEQSDVHHVPTGEGQAVGC